jgi:hypothetical protein
LTSNGIGYDINTFEGRNTSYHHGFSCTNTLFML